MSKKEPFDETAAETALLPKHEQLRAHLIREVREGRLLPGDALPTEHELAKNAGVSRNTVRQALGGLETNGVIRRIPGRGTFVHESALLRLKSGLDIFALVIPDTRGGFYPSLQRGFHEASVARNNQVLVCDTDNDPYRQADAVLQLIDKQVAGAAIVPTTSPATPAHQIRPLHERGIPVVFCHRRVEGVLAPLVAFSPYEVGRLAGQAMAARGHRRAAMLAAQRTAFSVRYEAGLRDALEAKGGKLPESFVHFDASPRMTHEHERFVENRLRDLLGHKSPPTAVFCPFDAEAELIYVLLGRMGIKVPEQMSLVGFGGKWREGALTRRLTSVTVDEEELGRHAARLLDEMRRRERPLNDVSEIVMPLSLYEGETLGTVSGKARAHV